MSILRAVQLQFKAGETAETIKNVEMAFPRFRILSIMLTFSQLAASVRELKELCVHPDTQKPYIKSIHIGADNSPEGLQDGVTHAIFMEFENAADRDYYALKDPAHQDFIKLLQIYIDKVRIVDITDGVC